MDEAAFGQFKDGSDLKVNLMLMQTGLPVERDEFVAMIDSWNAAINECGAYEKHGKFEIEASSKDITVKTEATYAERKATIEFKFDEKLNMKSMDVSAKYAIGEILQKAGLNTVLGMGTVFTVLIFLAFIISLLKYIPVFMKKLNSKENEKAAEPKETVQVQTAVVEEAADDLELVAAITAAIEAYTGTSSESFVVRSIKRRKSNNWN